VGFHFTPLDPGGYDRHVAALRAQLNEETYAAAWAEGRALSLDEAVALAQLLLEEEDHLPEQGPGQRWAMAS
jgi:hypothetical protein